VKLRDPDQIAKGASIGGPDSREEDGGQLHEWEFLPMRPPSILVPPRALSSILCAETCPFLIHGRELVGDR
jgi:hypothetical protein